MRKVFGVLLTTLVLAFLPLMPAIAEGFDWRNNPADTAAVAQYRLSREWLKNVTAFKADVQAKNLEPTFEREPTSLIEMAQVLDADPAIHAALVNAHLTGRDFVVGLMALLAAEERADNVSDDFEQSLAGRAPEELAPEDANLLFYFRHVGEIEAMMGIDF